MEIAKRKFHLNKEHVNIFQYINSENTKNTHLNGSSQMQRT
jgi:hypothetical protein